MSDTTAARPAQAKMKPDCPSVKVIPQPIPSINTFQSHFLKTMTPSRPVLPEGPPTIKLSMQDLLEKEENFYNPADFVPKPGKGDIYQTPSITNEYEYITTLIPLLENKIKFLATQQCLIDDLVEISMENMEKVQPGSSNAFLQKIKINELKACSQPERESFINQLSTIIYESDFYMKLLQKSPGYGYGPV